MENTGSAEVTTSGHTLKVTLDQEGIYLSIDCHQSDDAPCRRACTKCEDGCLDPEAHTEPLGFCHATKWVDKDTITDYYDGDNTLSLHDGMPITIESTGDGYVWRVSQQQVAND